MNISSIEIEEGSMGISVVEVERGNAQSLAWSTQSAIDYLAISTSFYIKYNPSDATAAGQSSRSRLGSKDESNQISGASEPNSNIAQNSAFILKFFSTSNASDKDFMKTVELYSPQRIMNLYGGVILGASFNNVLNKAEKKAVTPVAVSSSDPQPRTKRSYTIRNTPSSLHKDSPAALVSVNTALSSMASAKDNSNLLIDKTNTSCKFYLWNKLLSGVDIEKDSSSGKKDDGVSVVTDLSEKVSLQRVSNNSIPAPRMIRWDPTNTYVAFVYGDR